MSQDSVTGLLRAWRGGDERSLDRLMETVYQDLRRIARSRLARERIGHTLSPTGLVHETYLRLAADAAVDCEDRSHFFAVASIVMRRVLVEHARARKAKKRDALLVPLQEATAEGPGIDVDVLDLDAALERLEAAGFDRESKVIQLRFFGGLTNGEVAEHLGLGESTVRQAWAFAKTWLYRDLARTRAR